MFVVVQIVFLLLALDNYSVLSQQFAFNRIEFKSKCTQLKGVVDGGQCFFVGNVSGTWTQAWTVCQQNGAVLAQVHTSSEHKLIAPFVDGAPFFLWIALQRDTNVSGKLCAISNDTTYWYDSATQKNLQLRAENTWIRYHNCESYDGTGTEFCIVVNSKNAIYDDAPCEAPWYDTFPLCQLASPFQNYTKTNVCLTETPIEIFSATQPFDCAVVCGQRSWCRSFNFIDKNGICAYDCQLFSWSVLDQCPNCPKAIVSGGTACTHYNYDP